MRGEVVPQSLMFHYFLVESRIPANHPLCLARKLSDSALSAILGELDGFYAKGHRPSIPPERLLKAQLLIAFYSVRSSRQFCEQLDYNPLFCWLLDLDPESGGLDRSNFSRLRERLVEINIARNFFYEVVRIARKDKLLLSDHFIGDGTLIDAWASFKSFKCKRDHGLPTSCGDGTGMVDLKGEKRSNATHRSTTDSEVKLVRKGSGQPAKLSYGAMRSWRTAAACASICSSPMPPWPNIKLPANCSPAPGAAGFIPRSLGADKCYQVKDFVQHLRELRIKPHIARVAGRNTPGLGGRHEEETLYQPGPNLDPCVPVGDGIQPAVGCEIAGGGEHGMKRHSK